MVDLSSSSGATLVGLKRSDLANASATTVGAAFNSAIIDVVRDYGFDASGVSDNAAKLALLLTDVQKNVDGRGRRIRFAAGNYKFNSSMAFTAYATGLVHNIVLEGDSAGSTLLDFSGCAAGTDGVTFDAGAHITMRDLEITGAPHDGLVFGRGLTVGGASSASNVSVERVRVQNSGRHNLNITNTYLASFRDSWFKAAAANNVNINGFSTSLQFDRCEASESIAGIGWAINGAVYSTFNSCGSDSNNQQGYALSNCRGVVFNGCGAESNGKDSFLLFTSTASTTGIPPNAQDIHGVVFNGCFTLAGSTASPGIYATGWNATTADSRPIEFSLIGCSSHYSSSSERALILTGGSGQVTCVKDLYDDSSFTTADSRTGSYEVQNRSMAGRRALAVTSVAQTLTTGVQATMVLASLSINDMGATLSGNAIVIPRGVNKVRVTGSISWATNATGSRYIEIDKNGAAFIGMPVSRIPGLSSTLIQSVTSAVISVVPGDTLSLAAVQDSGGNLNINASSNFTFLCVEAVN